MSARRAVTRVAGVLGVMCTMMAFAHPPTPQPPTAGTAPLTPRAKSTGFSSIEQRYVYAPPDKGHIEFPMTVGNGAPNETLIMEPIMCQPQARAMISIDYDKAANTVKLRADFHKALPYRLSLTRTEDMSTPYNQFPMSVQNGKWQLWLIGHMFNVQTLFYYDAATLQLIGNEADFPAGPPANSIPVPVPTMQMLCSPMFEGNPQGDAHVEFTYQYDQILDMMGSAGTYIAFVPYNLCKPDQYGPYYINGGLPASRALSFDDILQSIWDGSGMGVSTSLEPDPKPAYLTSRDNTMIAWTGTYPMSVPNGFVGNPVSGLVEPLGVCQTRRAPKFPAAYFNVCGAP